MSLAAGVIIPSRNRPGMLWDAVAAVLAGDEVPTELIVIDQSDVPNARLAQLVPERDCVFQYIWTRTPGVSRARNLGWAASRQSVHVFIDDDVLVASDWLESLLEPLLDSSNQCAVRTGQVQAGAAESAGAFTPSVLVSSKPAVYAGRLSRDVLFTGNMAIARRVLEDIGGFDERLGPGTRFGAAEDNDLGLRLLTQGYAIEYVPRAVVLHRTWRSSQDRTRLRWNYGRGQGAFYAKHILAHDWLLLHRITRDITENLRTAAGHLSRGRPRAAAADAAYVTGLLSGFAEWLTLVSGAQVLRQLRRLVSAAQGL